MISTNCSLKMASSLNFLQRIQYLDSTNSQKFRILLLLSSLSFIFFGFVLYDIMKVHDLVRNRVNRYKYTISQKIDYQGQMKHDNQVNSTARADLENKITIFAQEQHNDTQSAQYEQPQLLCTETSSKVCRSPHLYLYFIQVCIVLPILSNLIFVS